MRAGATEQMTKAPFFSRRTPIFGMSNALVLLMVICFLVPFAMRGAKDAVGRMENDVKDWLPSDYQETKDLQWFGQHFLGEEFVLLTWEGCSQEDVSFRLLVDKLKQEVIHSDPDLDKLPDDFDDLNPAEQKIARHDLAMRKELLRARELGDELQLFLPDDERLNFSGQNEKWLQSNDGTSYFITEQGELYKWLGKDNLVDSVSRKFKRDVLGDKSVEAEKIDQFGAELTGSNEVNDFYEDPSKLTARYFTSVRSGMDALEELAGPGGPLLPRGGNLSEESRQRIAYATAMDRLTGTLFAPAVPPAFDWSVEAVESVLTEHQREQLPTDWKQQYESYLESTLDEQYAADVANLVAAGFKSHAKVWDGFFYSLDLDPPPRQTCIVVTLSDIGKDNLRKVVGRGVGGEPTGRIVRFATECGVEPPAKPPMTPWGKIPVQDGKVLRMGGPPVDNGAIDEEGQITLGRLVGLSLLLGVVLSYLSFRSLNVTIMVFFVGGVGAIMSMSIVGYSGGVVDSILLSMPSLVYVLGISGAVHIVNYYRDASFELGEPVASEQALAHGWGPCTLASFTTALGLGSLYISNLAPIKNFGLYSAIGVMATLILVFTYLPAALKIWVPKFKQKAAPEGKKAIEEHSLLTRMWTGVGHRVMKYHWPVISLGLLVLGCGIWGITKINTSVQLLKLFDDEAKIIRDYEWLETNFGKLTPMEMVIKVGEEYKLPSQAERQAAGDLNLESRNQQKYQLSMLERVELVNQIQYAVEHVFGDTGRNVIGQGMSAVTFCPEIPHPNSTTRRSSTNSMLENNEDRLKNEDYLAYDDENNQELWRISLRLGALNDVNYGHFIDSLKEVVWPIEQAYQFRNALLQQIEDDHGGAGYNHANVFFNGNRILVIGGNPRAPIVREQTGENDESEIVVHEKNLFSRVLNHVLLAKGFVNNRKHPSALWWYDLDNEKNIDAFTSFTAEQWKRALSSYTYVVMLDEYDGLDKQMVDDSVAEDARFIDLSGFLKKSGTSTADNDEVSLFAGVESQLSNAEDPGFDMIYTGVVPIVYKAQTSLLKSLINSIGLAFVMILCVMVLLLRNGKLAWNNFTNLRGGMVSMIPNVFPVVAIFGIMGHMDVMVDIGSMMTASVAMGVAVDDTIHFLTWFRKGMDQGMERRGALILAYERCAAAMTQTTLIGGLGLSVFAFSSFTPTQRFGTMMLTLLAAALVGDLLFLPALLASPIGKFFSSENQSRRKRKSDVMTGDEASLDEVESNGDDSAGEQSDIHAPRGKKSKSSSSSPGSGPHTVEKNGDRVIRHDKGHKS